MSDRSWRVPRELPAASRAAEFRFAGAVVRRERGDARGCWQRWLLGLEDLFCLCPFFFILQGNRNLFLADGSVVVLSWAVDWEFQGGEGREGQKKPIISDFSPSLPVQLQQNSPFAS